MDLILPEYGRNVQNMVEIAKRLETKEERNRCARSIIACMGNLFPYLRDNEAFRHKLWDHLAIMADFELDIDYPFEIEKAEIANAIKPEKITIPSNKIKYMHYGRFVANFIKNIANDPTLRGNKEIVTRLANYMKRCYSTFNQEVVNDAIIFNDLFEMSDGIVDYRNSDIKLTYFQPERKKVNKKQRIDNNNNRKG